MEDIRILEARVASKEFFAKYGIDKRVKGQRFDKPLLPGGLYDMKNLVEGQRTIQDSIVEIKDSFSYDGWGNLVESQNMVIRYKGMLVPAYRLKIGSAWCVIVQDMSFKSVKE